MSFSNQKTFIWIRVKTPQPFKVLVHYARCVLLFLFNYFGLVPRAVESFEKNGCVELTDATYLVGHG
ncbi:MAG: hypothetical protein DKT66_13980 [Candidatus Melainabacteria bacterium]|nr:MAG: hypothetical protein DKT66_13980 [Candidatus Melainabacteria bacterium]